MYVHVCSFMYFVETVYSHYGPCANFFSFLADVCKRVRKDAVWLGKNGTKIERDAHYT